MAISGLLLYIISGSLGLNIPLATIPAHSWYAIAYLVLFSSLLTFLAYIYALQHLPASQVSIYAYINPVVAVLIESMFFGEKLSVLIGVGGLTTLVGVYLVNQSFRLRMGKRS